MSDPVSSGGSRFGQKPEDAGPEGENDQQTRCTRCPYCQAVFRVGKSKLDVRQGEVRCGACREVFNALSHLVRRNAQGVFEPEGEVEKGDSSPVADQPAINIRPEDDEENNLDAPLSYRKVVEPEQPRLEPESPSSHSPGQESGITDPASNDIDNPARGYDFDEEEDEGSGANRKTPVFTGMDTPDRTDGFTSGSEVDEFGERKEPRLVIVDDDTRDIEIPVEEADSTTPETGVSRQNWFSVKPDPLLEHNPFAVTRESQSEEPSGTEKQSREESGPVTQAPSGQLSMQGVDQFIQDRKNPLVTVIWTLVAIGFVFLLGVQVKYYFVERFAGDDRYRPYLSGFCRIADCELPPRQDTYRFTITNTRIDLHPAEPGALRITVKLLNQARFSQPYPVLQLTLTDRLGRVVGRRSFEPSLYLHSEQPDLLDSGELETVMFDLAHPHEKAVGFVVDIVHAPNNV